jgi:hypothetical protein
MENAAQLAANFSGVARAGRLARTPNSGWYYAIHNLKQHHFLIDL